MSDAVATTGRYCWRVGGRVALVDGERCPECGDANHKELPSGTCGRFAAGYPCALPTGHAGYHAETPPPDPALAERAAVVAWLREVSEVYDRNGNGCAAGASYDLADAIERGEHVTTVLSEERV